MNVFEDLIGELKDENLLEETVIDLPRLAKAPAAPAVSSDDATDTDILETAQFQDPAEVEEETDQFELEVINEPVENPSEANAREFYRKRAIDEVSGLQMVDHVLSGVERVLMKMVPVQFDDLTVKKSLHSFLQLSVDGDPDEASDLEFQLMQETENWCSALAHRDREISAADLRRFCETSRPALSSQALIALAKFYRNLPHSESIRNKFDFVVTRLFSKEIAGEKRYLVFERDEMVAHFKTLYADWSSISLYASDDDNSDILLAALKFEDFMNEAESAESFDDLIRTEFFDRIRQFKESANEMFYAPIITSAAVECNVRIGNKILDLLSIERGKQTSAEDLYDKYGIVHDQVLSDATSKTTELVELLRERQGELDTVADEVIYEDHQIEAAPAKPVAKPKKVKKDRNKYVASLLDVNKWLLAATVVAVVLSLGLYVWSERFAGGDPNPGTNAGVVNFDIDSSSLNEHVHTARISSEVFYGIVDNSWNQMSQESKQAFVQKVLAVGTEKGFNKVQLCDEKGKVVAVASAGEPQKKNP